MGKKNKKPMYKIDEGVSITAVITNNLNKKGRIKGHNKRETMILEGSCQHHRKNNKGRIKPNVRVEGKVAHCRMCGDSFRGNLFNENEVKDRSSSFMEMVNQMKFYSVELGTGASSERYFSEIGSMVRLFPKNYNKVAKVARKTSEIKKKKNKNREYERSTMGSWR